MKAELERVDKRKQENAERLDKLGVLIADDEDPQSKAKLQAVLDAREKNLVVQSKFIAMSADDSKRDENVKYLLTTVRKEQTAYLNALTDLVKFQNTAVEQASTVAEQSYSSSRTTMAALTVVAVALAAWVLHWITRSITQPLNRAVGMAQAVAGGDLTMRMECHTTDETGQLLRALIDMNESLARTVGQVRSGTDTITNASNDRQRQSGFVDAHRAAGLQPGGDGVVDGGADLDRVAECRECAPGHQAGGGGFGLRHQGRAGGGRGGEHHGRHQGKLRQDCRHHQRD
ncbi:HAMP domain-containing protein [Duganella radicis]|uniref:HAMP domain-containing protein n=1 Tax=Duganella radicis TaxID=551988 RepID=UPI003530AEB5